MNVAFDLDGTIDENAEFFSSLASALSAAGHHVYVITGIEQDEVTEDDIAAKAAYLKSIGFTSYDFLYVCPEPHDTWKAKLVQDLDIIALLDNDKDNVKACAPYCTALLVWNTKK